MNGPLLLAIAAAAAWLAYVNGANDNFKGVATLLGSGTTDYRRALLWGTLTTLAGSVAAALLAGRLVAAFSGRGVVPDELVGEPRLLLAVAVAAAAVVLAATLMGLPVSTTHALVGGLAGAGLAAAGPSATAWPTLATAFGGPLLVSPLLAAGMVMVAYPSLRRLRMRMNVRHDTCFCMESPSALELRTTAEGGLALRATQNASQGLRVASARECGLGYEGNVFGFTAQRALDACHYLSSGAVSFARGLNDTPKIAALLLAGGALGRLPALVAVGAGMAIGALLQARRVARTMSFRITPMNAGQGFTANAATATIVVLASRFGVPVSTTHVSSGALFGLGGVTGKLRAETFRAIILAWVATLPAALVLAWLTYHVLRLLP